MVEAKIKANCRFGCRAGCRSGCRAKIPKALILRHFSLSDNHDNQYYKEKGNSKKIVSPDKEKRFSDVRCRNFVVRPFLVGLFHSRRNIVWQILWTVHYPGFLWLSLCSTHKKHLAEYCPWTVTAFLLSSMPRFVNLPSCWWPLDKPTDIGNTDRKLIFTIILTSSKNLVCSDLAGGVITSLQW